MEKKDYFRFAKARSVNAKTTTTRANRETNSTTVSQFNLAEGASPRRPAMKSAHRQTAMSARLAQIVTFAQYRWAKFHESMSLRDRAVRYP